MKARILAGGLGIQIFEETQSHPKPIIEAGRRPLLCHITKIYSLHSVNDFVVCFVHKGVQNQEVFCEPPP